MKLEVKNRFTGDVQFTAEIDTDSESNSVRLGLAVKWARSSGADLSGAYLRDADLRGAYLSGADLSGANLRDANLSGADLQHNKTVISCCLGTYQMFMHKRESLMVKAGCRYFSVEDAKSHWSPENQDTWTEKTAEYGERQLRMLAFLESEAELLGWLA